MELAKTTPEQRSEIYEDVRKLIVPGFLSHSFSLGEARFSIRSLDKMDWEILQHRTYGLTVKHWRAWCVASSVWMVNGSLCRDEEDVVYQLYEMFASLPMEALDTVYSILNGLMRRVQEASSRVEAYLYENESRHLWATEGPAVLHRSGHTGVRRYDNPVLSLWLYFNHLEDQREREEREWTMTKFMVGPHAPKGIKKLNAEDRKRSGDLSRRRESTQNQIYYEAIGLMDRKDPEKERETRARFSGVVMAETEEELRESMRRWVDGIKDDHDRVVDGVKSRIKFEVESRKEQNRKRREALDAALEEEGLTRSKFTPLVGEAGKKYIERMQERMPGASVVIDDHTHNSAYKKYIENNPEVGDMYVDEDGNLQSKTPVSEEMLEVLTKPEHGREGMSLQDQIQNRRPTLSDDYGDED